MQQGHETTSGSLTQVMSQVRKSPSFPFFWVTFGRQLPLQVRLVCAVSVHQSTGFQLGCPEAALAFIITDHPLVWLEQLGKALLGGEMVIKPGISYHPIALKSMCKIPFSPLEQKYFFHSPS